MPMVHIHGVGRRVKLLWSYEGQSNGETQQWEESLSISKGCWCKKCKGTFQSPDWFIQFVHQFEGGMQWRA